MKIIIKTLKPQGDNKLWSVEVFKQVTRLSFDTEYDASTAVALLREILSDAHQDEIILKGTEGTPW